MPLDPAFPTDPYAILAPDIRWYPGDATIGGIGRDQLVPPLVAEVRRNVYDWRQHGYAGASETSRSLLRWWFEREHIIYAPEATEWRWYFAQREAVESAIWLFEVARARDPHSLLRYDSSGAISQGMFDETWTRYLLKLATGAGKTKVASLLIAWSYFHKLYEPDSALSTNVLLIAPNIIVLDRLKVDFEDARIFRSDPLLPDNGWAPHGERRDWKDDFQMTVHVQDEVPANLPKRGNLFLTNIHRVGEAKVRSDPDDLTDFFLGPKPVGKTTDTRTDLGVLLRTVDDLVVINDEAHHVRADTQWFAEIEKLDAGFRRREPPTRLCAQFDLTATPRHNKGGIFVQTVSDYPLVEAIHQGVVKTPVLPDAASRARLSERQSDEFVERFQDHLELGVIEWRKSFDELKKMDKKSVLFIMTDDTANCDKVKDWLELRYPDLKGAVLAIHTNRSGDIVGDGGGKAAKGELETLRRESREIDGWESPYKVVVSVMVLREGWDVRGVTTIVGLRAYAAESGILPEQTLGRGLRRMFFGGAVDEKVSVTGTPAFLDFVEKIRNEGVELEQRPMGPGAGPAGPMVIEVDTADPEKDTAALDIDLPKLKPRIERQFYRFEDIDAAELPKPRKPLRTFTAAEQRQIVFRNINTGEASHTTELAEGTVTDWRHVVGYFAKSIKDDLRLVGGYDVLFGKVKAFVENGLFDRAVDLDDPNVLRNLSEVDVTRALSETLKTAINKLTVHDSGSTHVLDRIKLSSTRPQVVKRRESIDARKSLMNIVAGDNDFELEFARFLEDANDVQAFFKNTEATGFTMEYQAAGGGIIRNYLPDFVARDTSGVTWIVETKGREDIQDPRKWDRLKLWCKDATEQDAPRRYQPLFVRQEDWEALLNPVRALGEAYSAFGESDL